MVLNWVKVVIAKMLLRANQKKEDFMHEALSNVNISYHKTAVLPETPPVLPLYLPWRRSRAQPSRAYPYSTFVGTPPNL
jgi:hypothetical protein